MPGEASAWRRLQSSEAMPPSRAEILLRGRRHKGGVAILITRGNGDKDAARNELGGAVVDGQRVAAAEAHAGKDAPGARAAARVGHDVVHAGNDARPGTRAVVAEDLDAVDAGFFGHAVGGAGNGARAVGAVAVAVPVLIGEEALDLLGAAVKVGVAVVDARVEHVHARAGAGAPVVPVAGGGGGGAAAVIVLSARDARKAPGGVGLRGKGGQADDAVLLNVLDLKAPHEKEEPKKSGFCFA
ncbi:hypothetical protein CRV24_001397 [Beauveria bassiana]|nr:hypothetical protein CRV24_001397 [Beauveria bassiana]